MKSLITQSLQNGKYLLEREMEQSGFGVTYKAIDQILDRPVLIKTLQLTPPEASDLKRLKKKFLEDAKTFSRCSHPNIVKLRESFVENGLPYIVTDCVPGDSLARIVLPNNPLPEAVAIDYIRQVGEALKVIHNHGLVHRNINPENLILHRKTGQVVLIDFGTAKEFRSPMARLSENLTYTNPFLFSEGYAPIELYNPNARLAPATDIYSLAATLYTLLTARVPISSTLRDRIVLASPDESRPKLSDRVSRAIMQGMALKLGQRPATIEKWLALLPEVPKSAGMLETLVNPTNLSSPKMNLTSRLWILPLSLVSLIAGMGYISRMEGFNLALLGEAKSSNELISNQNLKYSEDKPSITSTSSELLDYGNVSALSKLSEPIPPSSSQVRTPSRINSSPAYQPVKKSVAPAPAYYKKNKPTYSARRKKTTTSIAKAQPSQPKTAKTSTKQTIVQILKRTRRLETYSRRQQNITQKRQVRIGRQGHAGDDDD